MMQWEKHILDLFFSADSLSVSIPFFCKHMFEKSEKLKIDPISSTLIVFLTCPLHLIIQDNGISFFQGKTSLLYPFNLMTDEQKKGLIELCEQPHEYSVINNTIVFKKSPEPLLAPLSTILQVLCTKVFSSKRYTDKSTQTAICNIIMQRLQGYVPISSQVQRDLNKWIQNNRI
jgi:hypothetical protein